jgi:hypothetical protein
LRGFFNTFTLVFFLLFSDKFRGNLVFWLIKKKEKKIVAYAGLWLVSHPIIFVRRMRLLIVTKTTILGLFQLLSVVPIFLNGACNVIHADLMLFELFIIILSLLLELHVGLQKLHSHSSICFVFSFKISPYYSSWDFFYLNKLFQFEFFFQFHLSSIFSLSQI